MKIKAHCQTVTKWVAALMVLSACGGDTTGLADTPASVVLPASTASLVAGGSVQLSAVVKNANGDVITGQSVTYSSDKPNIATVSATGLVTAVGPAGSANITASAGGVTSIAAVITVTPGAAQSLAKATDLPVSPAVGSSNTVSVKVTDKFGNPVSGTVVTFAATAGGGSVTSASATSDASGIAGTFFKLGNTVGTNSVSATASGLTGSPISFSVTSVAGPATTIAKIGTDPTEIVIGTTFLDSVRVKVTDAFGNAVGGTSIAFAATAGGGSVSPASAVTDANGKAASKFTTGTSVATNTATATATGITAVTFSTTTIPNLGSISLAAPGIAVGVSLSTRPNVTGSGYNQTFSVTPGASTLVSNLPPGTYNIAWPIAECGIQGGCGQPVTYGPSSATQVVTVVASSTALTASMTFVPITGIIKLSAPGIPIGVSLSTRPAFSNTERSYVASVGGTDTEFQYFNDVKPGTYTINWPVAECGIQGGCGQPVTYGPTTSTQVVTVVGSLTPVAARMQFVPITGILQLQVSGIPANRSLSGVVSFRGATYYVSPTASLNVNDVTPGTYTLSWQEASCGVQGGCGARYFPQSSQQVITIRASLTPAVALMVYGP